ncbi:MAG: cofactor-independent phosphoglycerate mutase [Methanocorpusculum sp.]|nr:cofactor-independent phosphoglycerate mutase [Methanocorpusculum sp.]MBQ4134957.1 cofactor-independent phosphoglycerate mutase [Methanocorpusculum sp.]MBR4117765.1 cofactor-independent phosphoglycerate mutase [Methanocorpusculum sp.]HJJ63607.1 cofactor-independent phosphoglycerate mutase [Methanocorpusculum sp.]HJJ72107.1 cofactor-independent phosphoglycerate mutase [Methanocorpusculum sp.]
MKYLLILADGAADEPLEELGGKTPLEVAKKPNMDMIARKGRCGMLKTVDESMTPGSDVANMSILGYDPEKYYTGRGALEALSMGVPFGDDDMAYRCNLVTIENGKMKDFAAGHITSEEGAELFKSLQEKIPGLRFYPGVSYRNVMMFPGGEGVESYPPHDIVDEVVDNYMPRGPDADTVMKAMVRAADVFEKHPVNLARKAAGKNPATTIWPWSSGKKPAMPKFEEMFGKKGAMISAVDLLFGIAACCGMEIVKVEGATGYLDTNYMGKAKAAVETLKGDADFVYMHVEATDEAGHLGSIEEKIKAIERLDEAIGYILENFDGCVMLMPDHPTPIAKKTHTHDAVPFVVMGKDEADGVTAYTEKDVRENGAYGLMKAVDLLPMVFSE